MDRKRVDRRSTKQMNNSPSTLKLLPSLPDKKGEEDKPNGFIDAIRNCMMTAKEELCGAFVIAKEKVHSFIYDDDSIHLNPQTSVLHTKSCSIKKAKKYHIDVIKSVEDGNLRKISESLEKHYDDQFFETRLALNAAVDSKRLFDLDWALDLLNKHGLNSKEINKMRHDAAIRRLKREIQAAMTSKNLNMLDCFAWDTINSEAQRELGPLLVDAIILRSRLNRLRCIRMAILNMDNSAFFEILNNDSPPPALQDTMAALYLLLGKSSKDVNIFCSCCAPADRSATSWPTIQKFMRTKDPKKSIKVLVSKFSGDIPNDVKHRAGEITDAHNHKSVHDASKHALVFYIWIMAMLREMETQNSTTLARIFANM